MRLPFSIILAISTLLIVHTHALTIGMSAPLSGASKNLGKSLSKTAELYFNKNTVHGQKIQIKSYDDHYDSAAALYNTVRLINQDNVDLLYGYVGTAPVTRILPLLKCYEAKNVRLFFPFTGAEPQRTPPYNDYVYNFRASYFEETKALVDRLVETGHTQIAVFYQADSYGRNGWEGVKKALARHNLHIVKEATYKRGSTFNQSYAAQINILNSQHPDAIIVIGAYEPSAGFIRDCRNANITVPIANISFVGATSVQKLLEHHNTKNLLFSQVVPNFEDDLPATKEYKDLIKSTDLTPSFVGFEGFLSAKLLVEILKLVPPPFTKEKLIKTLQKNHTYSLGIDTPVTLGDTQRQALHKIYFTTLEDNKFVTIKDWTPWQKK